MNRRKAIKLLEGQITKLKRLKSPMDMEVDFLIQTKTYIDKFFGSDSPQSKRLTGVPIAQETTPDFIPFLNDCIETINYFGLYKEKNKNILSTQNNWKLLAIATTIFIAGLSAGIWLKENTSFIVFPSVENSSNNHSNSESPPK